MKRKAKGKGRKEKEKKKTKRKEKKKRKKQKPLADNTNAENSFQNTKTFSIFITDQST